MLAALLCELANIAEGNGHQSVALVAAMTCKIRLHRFLQPCTVQYARDRIALRAEMRETLLHLAHARLDVPEDADRALYAPRLVAQELHGDLVPRIAPLRHFCHVEQDLAHARRLPTKKRHEPLDRIRMNHAAIFGAKGAAEPLEALLRHTVARLRQKKHIVLNVVVKRDHTQFFQ